MVPSGEQSPRITKDEEKEKISDWVTFFPQRMGQNNQIGICADQLLSMFNWHRHLLRAGIGVGVPFLLVALGFCVVLMASSSSCGAGSEEESSSGLSSYTSLTTCSCTSNCIWFTLTVILIIVGQLLLVAAMVIYGRVTWMRSLLGGLLFIALFWIGVLYVSLDAKMFIGEDEGMVSAIVGLICIIMEGCFLVLFVVALVLSLLFSLRKEESELKGSENLAFELL